MPDRPLPEPADPEVARAALQKHSPAALEDCDYEYDGDRTIYLKLTAVAGDGKSEDYLVRMQFLYYPDWPPCVTFLNPETRQYDGTHWPQLADAPKVGIHPAYAGAPAGMVCNSMTFEYYFWGGHNPSDGITWKAGVHTFAATISELKDHLRQPYYRGRAT